METYKNYKIGDQVKTNTVLKDYSTVIPAGTIFTIKKFVPCTIPGKHKYFVLGQIETSKQIITIRAFLNEITKD